MECHSWTGIKKTGCSHFFLARSYFPTDHLILSLWIRWSTSLNWIKFFFCGFWDSKFWNVRSFRWSRRKRLVFYYENVWLRACYVWIWRRGQRGRTDRLFWYPLFRWHLDCQFFAAKLLIVVAVIQRELERKVIRFNWKPFVFVIFLLCMDMKWVWIFDQVAAFYRTTYFHFFAFFSPPVLMMLRVFCKLRTKYDPLFLTLSCAEGIFALPCYWI